MNNLTEDTADFFSSIRSSQIESVRLRSSIGNLPLNLHTLGIIPASSDGHLGAAFAGSLGLEPLASETALSQLDWMLLNLFSRVASSIELS